MANAFFGDRNIHLSNLFSDVSKLTIPNVWELCLFIMPRGLSQVSQSMTIILIEAKVTISGLSIFSFFFFFDLLELTISIF